MTEAAATKILADGKEPRLDRVELKDRAGKWVVHEVRAKLEFTANAAYDSEKARDEPQLLAAGPLLVRDEGGNWQPYEASEWRYPKT